MVTLKYDLSHLNGASKCMVYSKLNIPKSATITHETIIDYKTCQKQLERFSDR